MTEGANRSSAPRAERRGLWQALVDADVARRAEAVEADIVELVDAGRASDSVIDLASHAHAHLGYLERVGAYGDEGLVDGEGSAVIVDLDAHRSRRALSA